MAINLLGTKIGMTQVFDPNGNIIPVTVIQIEKACIIQKLYKEKNGYDAIQIGFRELTNTLKKTKPYLGVFRKNGLSYYQFLRESKISNLESYHIGQQIDSQHFKLSDCVNVTGKTIGKGFSGNIKKNHFKRGPESHGSKHHRLQGSLGAGTTPGRVFPGKKMAGKLGNENRTIKNLKIIDLDLNLNLITVKGCVPGKSGSLITITKSYDK